MVSLLSRFLLISALFCASLVHAEDFIPQTSNRVVYDFNTDWKAVSFNPNSEDPAQDYAGSSVNDNSWDDVNLPHLAEPIDQWGERIGNRNRYLWYRRHFSVPAAYSDRKVTIHFDAAGQVNDVYVNGQFVGTYLGRWTPFTVDVTDYINFGASDNVIAVRLDDDLNPQLPPAGGDMFWHRGLHGEARMIITDPLNVAHTFVWTEKNAGGGVDTTAKIQIENSANTAQTCTVITSLVDADNQVVSSLSTLTTIQANSTDELVFEHFVADPHLWSPNDPYLYTVRTQIQKSGDFIDDYTTTTGLRWVSFENVQHGDFYLNDEPIRLIGGNKHAFFPYLSGSAPDRLWRKDAHILRYQLGLDSIRTSHYTTDPGFLDECDKVGLLVIEEAPGWGFTEGLNPETDRDGFRAQFERSLEVMIKRDLNHPSIIMWSILPNEGHHDGANEWGPSLNTLAKSIDTTRPTIQEYTGDPGIADIYSSHNYGALKDDGEFDLTNTPNPPGPWMVGEHNDSFGNSFLMPHDAEWRKIQNLDREMRILRKFWSDDRIFGAHHWSSLAIYSVNSDIGKGWNSSWRGSPLVGRLRETTWLGYAYQAQAEQEQVGDVLYICNEWKSDSDTTVYVASNCDEVELFKGGVSLGRITPNYLTELPQGLFKWDNVTWSAGTNLVAKGYNNGLLVKEYTRYPTSYAGSEDSVVIYPTTGTEIYNDGVDLTYIIAEIRDTNGQNSFYADGNMQIHSVTGPGEAFLSGAPIWMADGRAGFYIRGDRDQTGTVTVKAKVDVGELYNNDETGTGLNQFDYTGSWSQQTGVSDAVEQDFHVSSTGGDYFEFRFTGTQIRWYGEAGPGNGIAAVSINGGSESNIDCFAKEDYMRDKSAPHYMFYESPILTYGEHTLKVRVTGNKDNQSTGKKIATDSVKVYTGDYSMVSNPLEISVVPTPNVLSPVPGAEMPKILTVNSGSGGHVLPAGAVYNHGSEASLTAIPDAGWAFNGWTGDLSGTSVNETLTMDANKTVTAQFIPIGSPVTLTVTEPTGGSIDPDGGTYAENDEIVVTATPDAGWEFDSWTGSLSGSSNPTTLLLDGDKTIGALFSEVPQVTLTVTSPTGGSITPSGGIYSVGAEVAVTATADSGWQFVGWTGDLSGTTNPTTLTMDADKTISAAFSETVLLSATYQAEDATINGGAINTNGNNWNGTGFVDLYEGGYVEWTVTASSAGAHDLSFRYAGNPIGMAGEVRVNGSVVAASLSMPSTGSSNAIWTDAEVTGVQLNAGTNTVRLTDAGENQPQMDELTVTRLLTELQSWRYDNFGSISDAGDSADTFDFDLDGMKNLLEYALGTSPVTFNAVSPIQHTMVEDAGKQYLTLTVTRSEKKTDVSYFFESSGDLSLWNSDNISILQDTATLFQGRDDTPVPDGTERFIRFGVSQP